MPIIPQFAIDVRLIVSADPGTIDTQAIRDCVLTTLLNACPFGWKLEGTGPTVRLEDVDVFSVTPDVPNPSL